MLPIAPTLLLNTGVSTWTAVPHTLRLLILAVTVLGSKLASSPIAPRPFWKPTAVAVVMGLLITLSATKLVPASLVSRLLRPARRKMVPGLTLTAPVPSGEPVLAETWTVPKRMFVPPE